MLDQKHPPLPTVHLYPLYSKLLLLKAAKSKDMKTLLDYTVTPNEQTYYKELLESCMLESINVVNAVSEDEWSIDEDDNSK